MAHIIIEKYLTLGSGSSLAATSYQVAKDPEFTEIIDEIHESREFRLKWWTPLPKPGGGYYRDEVALYARVKLFREDNEGNLYSTDDWYVLPVANQVKWNEDRRVFTGDYDKEEKICNPNKILVGLGFEKVSLIAMSGESVDVYPVPVRNLEASSIIETTALNTMTGEELSIHPLTTVILETGEAKENIAVLSISSEQIEITPNI